MEISQHKAEYINYNLKCFFEHYELEKRILKISADNIILAKMTQEVNQIMKINEKVFAQDNPMKHTKMISQRPQCNPKIATNIKTLERKRQMTKDQLLSKKSIKNDNNKERALTTDKKKPLNRSITKSPTTMTHRTHKSLYNTPTMSKEKSVRNLQSNTKSLDFGTNISTDEPTLKTSKTVRNKIQMKKETIKKDQEFKQHKSKDFNTIKKAKTNGISINNEQNKKIIKSITPTISRGNTPTAKKDYNKPTPTTPKIGSKIEKKTTPLTPKTPTSMTKKAGKKITMTRMGEFKDQTNRAISPIESSPGPKLGKVDKNKEESKKSELTLNTSKQSIDTDSENEITEGMLQAQKNKHINTYISPRVLFSSITLESLYLAMKTGYINVEKKIQIAIHCPELLAQFPIKGLYKELLQKLEKKYTFCEQFLSQYESSLINKQFSVSKTAQNGLNFITKEEEDYLLKKVQPIEIIQLYTIVLILLNENITLIPENERISYLINIYPKYNVDNLSKSFLLIHHIPFRKPFS